jgi:hypothetical protein
MNWTTTGIRASSAPDVRNDPRLLEAVLVHVSGNFCVGGRPVEIGSEIRIARHDAMSLEAQKKCVIVLAE